MGIDACTLSVSIIIPKIKQLSRFVFNQLLNPVDYKLFFRVFGIRNACSHRAYCSTLRFIKMPDTLHALIEIDHIYGIGRSDSLHRALRLAKTTGSAIVGNLICHYTSLMFSIIVIFDK
jgi:hypothetical protein